MGHSARARGGRRLQPGRHDGLVAAADPTRADADRHGLAWPPVATGGAADRSRRRGKQLWLSHGTHDDIIPQAHAQAVVQHMAPLPVTLSYREFPGAHEIRPEELTATVAWLESLTTGPVVR